MVNGRIPILRLNVRDGNHVVECLDRSHDFWYVVKTFGSTMDEYRKAIIWLNDKRNEDEEEWRKLLANKTLFR